MKDKNISDQIFEVIKKSNKILLHCHPSPDPDSVGSVLALASVLNGLGKDVTAISGDSAFPEKLIGLPNSSWLVNKNYTEVSIEEFDLFIILDSSSPSQITRLEDIVFPDSLMTVVIDHHVTNSGYAKINYIDSSASSTAEVLYNLFSDWGVEINKDTALCLFIGIFGDTGGFKYTNTSPETLGAVYKLGTLNPGYHEIIFDLENSSSPEKIAMKGMAFSSVKTFNSGKVAISSITFQDMQKKNITKEFMTAGLIGDELRKVVGWDLVISLVEAEPNVVTVSMRTRDQNKFDVSKIALAVGKNGGGHKAAAGTTIYASIEEAVKELVDVIAEIFPELGGV